MHAHAERRSLKSCVQWRFDNSAKRRDQFEKHTTTTKRQKTLKKNKRQSSIYDFDWSSDSFSVYKKRLSYLNMTGHSQQFNCTGSSWKLLGSSYSSSAKLFANVSNIENIHLIYTHWKAGFEIPLSPKNASKVIFNWRKGSFTVQRYRQVWHSCLACVHVSFDVIK